MQFGIWIVLAALAANAQDVRKKRVAVLDFEFRAVRPDVNAMFGTEVDIGRGMAALLVKQLVNDGTYTVLEGRMVESVVREQDFSNRSRSEVITAVRVGRLLGVDAIISGTIVEFGTPMRQRSGGGVGLIKGEAVGGGVSRASAKAMVSADVRMVDIDTGEIRAVVEGKGQSSRSATSVALFWNGAALALGYVDFSSNAFLETIIGEAVKDAAQRLSAGVIAANAKLDVRSAAVEGLVAFADNTRVVLNVGLRAGLLPGDKFSIERVTEEIRDPANGNVIRRLTEKIAEVQVTEAADISAVCIVLAGSGIIIGDQAKTVAP